MREPRIRWDKSEIDFLHKNAGAMNISEIAFMLGRTEKAVKMMAQTYGVPLRSKRVDPENGRLAMIKKAIASSPLVLDEELRKWALS